MKMVKLPPDRAVAPTLAHVAKDAPVQAVCRP
jgi:hypothetical protein